MQRRASRALISGIAFAGLATLANAQLTTTRTDSNPNASNFVKDGVISANEYGAGNSQVYQGSGSGFGGALGNGALYMDTDASNLYVGLKLGNDLNDVAVIYFDTKAGGFTDATMNDTSDGGRAVITNLTRDSNDVFPFEADYALIIGNFGTVTFELTSGSLNFLQYDGQFTGNSSATAREVSLPKSSFAIGNRFDFFAAYSSDSNFLSDETIPTQGFSGTGNPGFGNPASNVLFSHFNRFQLTAPVPEPGALAVFGLGGLSLLSVLRRRRK